MTSETRALIVDLVEWVAARPRTHGEVMDAWRISCPRLTVWEDAVDQGFVRRVPAAAGAGHVEVTPRGRALLAAEGRPEPIDRPACRARAGTRPAAREG